MNDFTLLEERKEKILSIIKPKFETVPEADVYLVLDTSYSMESLFFDGTVQNVLNKSLPIGLSFDNNQSITVLTFSNECLEIGEVNRHNLQDYVKNKVLKNIKWAGTCYSSVFKYFLNKVAPKKSFLKSIFSSTSSKEVKLTRPSFVIFITDGDCNANDREDSESSLIKLSKYPVFFHFIGIGNSHSFTFLNYLDNLKNREFDNASFESVKNINVLSDDELYQQMFKEYPEWYKKVKPILLS